MAPPTATATETATETLARDTLKSTSADSNARDSGAQTISVKLPYPEKVNAVDRLPDSTRNRFERHHIDLSHGYPEWPSDPPLFIDQGYKIRGEEWEHIERGRNADPEKKALFGAATEVRDLTKYVGTEIVGLQLADLTDQQRDELALLIAERVVVFFRDQDLSPQKQLELGAYFGKVEVHPRVSHVPGLEGITVLWPQFGVPFVPKDASFKRPAGAYEWHADLTHEIQPAGVTHLHNDAIPAIGGDTLWASGYGAWDKLSRPLQRFLEGKKAVYRSHHGYIDPENPLSGPKYIDREHLLVRTHPATGWKYLAVNKMYTKSIVGLEPKESDAILKLLFDVYEGNPDTQVRFTWQPTKPGLGTSALWDNRIAQHRAVWDYVETKEGESYRTDVKESADQARHGTRVTSLADKPYLDPASKSQREALNLANP